ncbi:adenosine kinase [Candidatus Woesearchaeota archaeon]|nr:adenosine kinase [Candidatus Woesearchaeota archaeon]
MTKFDVFGIGNALMDVLIQVDNSHLEELDLEKGVFHLFDSEKIEKILERLKDKEHKLIPAGGTTNTIMGIANLGGRCVLCGKIGRDRHGDAYEEIIVKENIKSNLSRCDIDATGRNINLITPDAERTFAVNLGAAINKNKEDVFDQDIKNSKIFYFTGYEFESMKEVVLHALDVAKENGVKIAFDLADPKLVERNFEEIGLLLKSVDIVFMNEAEAEALTGLIADEAAAKIGEDVDIVVVKVCDKGSFVFSQGETFKIEPFLKKAVDTTGAGDLYAAGFLYGYVRGKPLDLCGKYGSYMASKIVEVIGAKLENSIKDEIDKLE